MLGNVEVGVVGLGCNNFGLRADEDASRAVIDAALDAGINLLDTADSYGNKLSEEIIGRAIAGRRSEVVIATKYGAPDGDPSEWGPPSTWIVRKAEESLRKLGTDHIDLFQQHFPPGTPGSAPAGLARPIGVTVEESLEALDGLVRAGKVLAIGTSNFSGAQLSEAASAAERDDRTPFVSAQNELSLLRRAALDDVLPTCDRLGLAFLPYFPLAAGVLSGKYVRGGGAAEGTRLAGQPARRDELLTDETFDLLAALGSFAGTRGHTLLELAFAWLLAHRPVCSVIAGAMTPAQVRANVAAGEWELTQDDLAEVDRLLGAAPA
jgi:aryl-alcohol dehydrogenase-like predicted oxidoreductase